MFRLAFVLAVLCCALSFFIHIIFFAESDSTSEHSDLKESYTFDFEGALKKRTENMRKYSFPFKTLGVDRRSDLSLQEFHDVYDGVWPVIITDVVPTWPAFNWNVSFFNKSYGDANIVMSTSNKSSVVVQMRWFLEHLHTASEDSWLYLQDELFLLQHQQLRRQVGNSIYTQENYFENFPEEVRPWDCYFLWGTAHSRSSLHIDPYNWTGTNAVISGWKKWKLILPGQDKLLSVFPDRICGFPLECKKYNSPLDLFSNTREVNLLLNQLKFVEAEQKSGDLLIIPTGWFHQAYNQEPTLALSQQIMNKKNLMVVLEEIFKADNLPRSCLTDEVLRLPSEHLVNYVMANLPKDLLFKGAQETHRVLESIQAAQTDHVNGQHTES